MSAEVRHRIALLHGPNLNMLGRRPSEHYGTLDLSQLEDRVRGWGAERGMAVACFQTNHEGAFLEHVHGLAGAVEQQPRERPDAIPDAKAERLGQIAEGEIGRAAPRPLEDGFDEAFFIEDGRP